jgi:hypothetical protein
MWLFNDGDKSAESIAATNSSIDALNAAYTAFKANIGGDDPLTVFKNIEKTMIGMMNQSMALQRGMGGVINNTEEFQNRLNKAYKATVDIGGTFQDTVDAVQGISDGMGKVVSVSDTTITKMVELSQATQLSTKEIGGMVAEMVRFGGTQQQAVEAISKMAKEARGAGLSGKQFTTEIGKNLKNLSGFGFKSGVEGLKGMVKQAMLLRTNIEAIGALKVQDSVLEPEGAIELAANFQMLGGAVGKLADPFQLMYMAQNDVEGLQKELVNSTKAAMTFNKETGNFDISTEDMYRLRQQAKLTGANLEDLVNTGREAAKLDYIKEKFDLSGLPEEQQNLISQLATVGKDGSLTVDIPGYGEIKAANKAQLDAKLKDAEVTKALEDYQKNQDKSDRQLAEASLTVAERQAATQNEIKTAVINMMSDSERKKYAEDIAKSNQLIQEKTTKGAEDAAGAVKGAYTGAETAQRTSLENMPAPILDDSTKNAIKERMDKISDVFSASTFDLIVPKGGAPKVMTENAIYQGIVGDEVFMGTNLSDIFNGVKNLGGVGGTNVGGKVDVNINISGAVNGDGGNISKIFENPKVQKQIMDTVLYKLDSYKKQQGVLS